jgi:hypothetical protein
MAASVSSAGERLLVVAEAALDGGFDEGGGGGPILAADLPCWTVLIAAGPVGTSPG